MTPTLAFDIETIPDVAGIRRLLDLRPDIPDHEVADLAFYQRRQATGHDFLPLHLHRVVAIACALRDAEGFRVWSLGKESESEGELLQRFYDGIDRFTPQLVSWNGGGFDLPVMHYRSLVHGVNASRYWDLGEEDRDFKYNNYLNRYHTRHLDLMDLLSLFQARASAPLDQISQLLGFPGKLGMDGSKVWDAYQRGELADIRHYCETDTVNTYLVYLRFELTRGHLSPATYATEVELVRDTLGKAGAKHWKEFLEKWPASTLGIGDD